MEELAKSKLEKPKRLQQQAHRDWQEIKSGSLQFQRRQQEADALRQLSKADLCSFFQVRPACVCESGRLYVLPCVSPGPCSFCFVHYVVITLLVVASSIVKLGTAAGLSVQNAQRFCAFTCCPVHSQLQLACVNCCQAYIPHLCCVNVRVVASCTVMTVGHICADVAKLDIRMVKFDSAPACDV